ncbi:MAG TPA: hypothetical protein V6C81_07850 [Planktothrix sp.]|jgi:hypothetical protein
MKSKSLQRKFNTYEFSRQPGNPVRCPKNAASFAWFPFRRSALSQMKNGCLAAAVACLVLLMPAGCASFAEDRTSFKNSPRLVKLKKLRGTVDYTDFDFGIASSNYSGLGGIGIKSVDFEPHLYVEQEKEPSLLQQPAYNESSMIRKREIVHGDKTEYEFDSFLDRPRLNESGWTQWYGRLLDAVATSWPADIPGQCELLIEVTRNGLVSVQTIAFVPAVGADDRFATERTKPGVRENFIQGVVHTLSHISKEDLAFPAKSTSRSVRFQAIFASDRNLNASVTNLSSLSTLPQNESTLWRYRICALLETRFLYPISEILERKLPSSIPHPVLPINGPHRYFVLHPDVAYQPAVLQPGGITDLNASVDKADMEDAGAILDHYLEQGKYSQADEFAKYLVLARDFKLFTEAIKKELAVAI